MSSNVKEQDQSADVKKIFHDPWDLPKFEDKLSNDEKIHLRKKVQELSILKQYIPLFDLFFDWAIIAITIFVAVEYLPLWIWPITLVIIACRQHALLVLMHDACHFTFLRNYKFSDFLTNIFAAYPMFIATENFRFTHLQHHRYLNTEKDPDLNVKKEIPEDWTFPKTKKQLLFLFLRELCGGATIEMFRKLKRFSVKNSYNKSGKPNSNIYLRISFYAVLFLIFFKMHLFKYYLIFWLVPALFILPLLLRIRSIVDHFGLPGTSELNSTRNLLIPSWQKFIFAPHNIGVHVVHHLYPSAPYYNLLKLNNKLNEFSVYKSSCHTNTSLIGFTPAKLLNDLINIKPKLVIK